MSVTMAGTTCVLVATVLPKRTCDRRQLYQCQVDDGEETATSRYNVHFLLHGQNASRRTASDGRSTKTSLLTACRAALV